MPSSWNVNDYKTDYESEEHWELRKSFMLAHKDKLPEDEIVCMAQVFTNIELLGCRYPEETMIKVAELAKGVVEPYRERKKNCLKRTFVAASDAAVAKVKGQRSSSELNQTNEASDIDETSQTNPKVETMQTIQTNPTVETMQTIQTNPTVETMQTIQTNPTVETMQTIQTNPTVETMQTIQTNPAVQTTPTTEGDPTIQATEENPTVQTLEGIQATPITQTVEENQAILTDKGNPAVQTVRKNQAVEAMQKIQTIPTVKTIKKNPTVEATQKTATGSMVKAVQKIRKNSTVQTNPVTPKKLTNQAIQTIQAKKTDQMVQTYKVDQIVQTNPPDEATQTAKASHTTQGTQTAISRIQKPVKLPKPMKQQKNQKRNMKKTLKKGKDADNENDDDDSVNFVNTMELTDIKRCIWDDVEISGHTNSHSDQLNTKGNNCSDTKQSNVIEFLAASTNPGYTLDPIGVKKLNELKPRFVFFLYDEPPVNLLQRNATLNRGTLRWHFDGQKGHRACSVYYNGILLGSSDVCAKKQAKEKAAKEAIKNLRSLCYTVKIKKHVKCLNKVTPAALGCPDGEIKLKSAIGEQIMRLMGWSGGGLGVKQQGMIQPVSLLPNTGRDGLGLSRNVKQDPGFRKRADAFLKKWIQTDSEEDLVFSTEFTQAQREILHKVASDLNLKSRSYGKNDERYIVIYKKPIPWLIVEKLVKMGGSTNRYELIIPTVTIP